MTKFFFECKLRFDQIPLNESHLLLVSLENMVQELPIHVWNNCFPLSLPSVPSRSLSNLHLAIVNLQKIPSKREKVLVNALDALSRDTYGRGAERRPRITGINRELHVILAKPIKDRPDWEAIHLDQFRRRIRFLAIERRSRTDTDNILDTKLPAWMDSYFDTIIHNYSEVTDGALTCFKEYMEQAGSINPSKLEPVSDFFDADALNNILTERSSVSTFRSRPNNFIQQFGESTTRKKKFRFMVTGD
ncbi:hypothetical protein P9112_009776 [Eukaryota sp. TZLM1-RC]